VPTALLNAGPDALPKTTIPQRTDINATTRHVAWAEDTAGGEDDDIPELAGDEEEHTAPPLGEDEEIYDDFFWEAIEGEEESENIDLERRTIILEPTEGTVRGTTKEAVLLKWHRILGHINPYFLLRISRNVKGMEEVSRLPANTKMPHCDAFAQAKSKKQARERATFKRYPEVMYMLHSDLSGRMRVPSLQGARYFVVFLDDASNYKFVFLLKTKDKWLEALKRITVTVRQEG